MLNQFDYSKGTTYFFESAANLYVTLGRVSKLRLAHPFRADYLVFVTLKTKVSLPAVELIRAALQRLAT